MSRILLFGGEDESPPVTEGGGEVGPIKVVGTRFVRADGTTFQWRGATDFLLLHHLLHGKDIAPVLDDRIGAGANVLRVLGMVDSFAHLHPQEHANYFTVLLELADTLKDRGLRMEFTVFADAQIIMPLESDCERHADRVAETLRNHPNVFLEAANEPFKNLRGGAQQAYLLGKRMQGHGVLVATGNYEIPTGTKTLPHCDYVTVHTERKPEWVRTPRALAEIRDGMSWPDGSTFEGVKCPVVGDEPTGFAEVPKGDSRSSSPDDAAYYAAASGLMGAGATFHSDDGLLSQVWSPVQRQCAAAFFDALKWVSPEAQFANYQRGGRGGGAGVGDMPIDHHDLDESVEPGALRTFCKEVDGKEYCVAIRPSTGWTAKVLDRWRVTDEPRRGLVGLEK